MMIFDFITQDEMDDLSDDDPQEAFTRFVEIARRRLADHMGSLGDDEAGWHQRNEAEHGFMNVVIAAAKRFEIDPLASLVVPKDEIQFRRLPGVPFRSGSLSYTTTAQQQRTR